MNTDDAEPSPSELHRQDPVLAYHQWLRLACLRDNPHSSWTMVFTAGYNAGFEAAQLRQEQKSKEHPQS